MMKEFVQSNNILVQSGIFLFIIAISCAATYYYRKIAIRRAIVAKMNFRTLHSKIIPRGGGVGFSAIFSILVICLWLIGVYNTWLMLALGVGGLAASFLGFIDDIYEINVTKKLIAQTCLSVFFFIVFFYFHGSPLNITNNILLSLGVLLFWLFVPLWFINLFNFIDGIDGMAVTGTIFVCLSAILVLCLKGGNITFILIFVFLTASCIGFSFFNLPPATLFMGDSGSIFLGYCMGVLALITIFMGEITIWNWIIFLSYYLADTTTTTGLRILLIKKWYGVHRSHAYQNLARITGSHAKITYGVLAYNFIWVLPLLIWSIIQPGYAPLSAVLSITPPVIWTFRYGPLLSKD